MSDVWVQGFNDGYDEGRKQGRHELRVVLADLIAQLRAQPDPVAYRGDYASDCADEAEARLWEVTE